MDYLTPTPTSFTIFLNDSDQYLNYGIRSAELLLDLATAPTNRSESSRVVITAGQVWTLIVPYSVIFVLAIAGNALVIITLGANRRMRSVTNMFLLNLAVSDLLLGVFCMPFTLVGVLLKQFVFGHIMCSLISYLQAVSVGVSVSTLVVMSVERYYAICHPLKSRVSRQTLSHAYKMIALIWMITLITMSPIAVVSKLKLIDNTGKYKCRESWPSVVGFEMFTIFLDVVLLIVPLIIMSLTYTKIGLTLKNNLKDYAQPLNEQPRTGHQSVSRNNSRSVRSNSSSVSNSFTNGKNNGFAANENGVKTQVLCPTVRDRPRVTALRSSADPIAQENRQRCVIKMLFIVVLEFFICWTPIYTINTITLYNPRVVYQGLGYNGVSFFHLVAFFSSCTNPIIYCFMNSRFRQSFLLLFRCRSRDLMSATTLHNTSYRRKNSIHSIRSQRYKLGLI